MKAHMVALAVALLGSAVLVPAVSATPTDDYADAPLSDSVPPSDLTRSKEVRALWGADQGSSWSRDSGVLMNSRPPCRSFELDNIHASHHEPGRMNVELRLQCNFRLQTLHIWAQLWEVWIWGWDRIGVKGKTTLSNANRATVQANDKCRNNLIRATSGGWAFHNLVYYSSSGPTKYANNPCNL